MKMITMAMVGLVIAGCAGAAGAASSSASSSSGSSADMSTSGCKVVHLKPGENPPTRMSTSINAGNGQVSGHTTVGGGGTGVSVNSGSGASVSSGSGASSSSMSTSSNGKMTKVTSSDGGCTVYIRD
jgi:hypothetical protein